MHEITQDFWDISKLPQPKAAIEAGDLGAALRGFAMREMLDYRLHGRYHSDVWICGFGATLWMMGDTYGAAKIWSRACDESLDGKLKYSSTGNFQSGLLLWFASVWLKNDDLRDESLALFDKLLRRRRTVMGAQFSTLLAKFIRREIGLEAIQSSFQKNRPEDQWHYNCVSLFYAGVRAFQDGNPNETRELWSQVKERTHTAVALEYYLMVYEKNKLAKRG